jgi:hypothetical protein
VIAATPVSALAGRVPALAAVLAGRVTLLAGRKQGV